MNRWLRPIHAPSAVTAKVTRACTTPRNQTLPYRRQSCAAFSDNNSSRPQRSHPCFFGSKLFSKKQRNEPPLPRRVEGSGEAETLFEKSPLSPGPLPQIIREYAFAKWEHVSADDSGPRGHAQAIRVLQWRRLRLSLKNFPWAVVLSTKQRPLDVD